MGQFITSKYAKSEAKGEERWEARPRKVLGERGGHASGVLVKDKMDGTVRAVLAHEIIEQYLNDNGFHRSLSSIQNKIKSLKKKYHAPLASNKKSGSGRKSFRHYEILHEILGA